MNELEPCRTYVDHLRAEHRQVHAEVHRIKHKLFGSETAPDQLAVVCGELSILDDELRRHFTEEEEGGCLEEAVSRCPSVSREANALLREHAGLLASLDHLMSRVKRDSNAEWLQDVQAEFDRFAKDLLAHEAAENRVMERAFGVMVNGDSEE